MRIPDKVHDDEEDSGSDSDDDEDNDEDDENDDYDATDESSEIVNGEGIGGIRVTKIVRPGPQQKTKWRQLEQRFSNWGPRYYRGPRSSFRGTLKGLFFRDISPKMLWPIRKSATSRYLA